MGAPRPLRPVCTPLLGLLLLGGCDKLPGGGDDDSKTDEETDKTDAEDKAKKLAETEAEAAKKLADEAAKKLADHEAADKLAADEATKKLADHEAADKLAAAKKLADEAKSRPVNLADIQVKAVGGMFGGSGMLEIKAKATLNQALGNSTYVHIKSLCKKDALLVADVGYLNAHYSKPLEQYAVGEEAEVTGNLYTQGLNSTLSPCQFEFRVGGIAGGISIPVGEACWNGSEVAMGACDPALVPIAMSGAGKPLKVHSLNIEGSGGMGSSSNGLKLDYLLEVHEPQENNVRITFKTACRIEGKTFVDLGQANLSAGPFRYEPGETVARSANLYWSSAFELADAPDDCDVTTSLWKTKAGTFGEYEEVRLHDGCFKGGSLAEGRCDPAAAAPPPASPLVAESVSVDEVKLELSAPYGATDKLQLKIQADVTLEQTVGQNDGVTAKVSCKAGKDKRVESAYLFGVEPHYLGPGETTRMTASAFGSHPLDTAPKYCQVEFFGGPRFSATGTDGVDLGKFCLKKEKVKKGKC